MTGTMAAVVLTGHGGFERLENPIEAAFQIRVVNNQQDSNEHNLTSDRNRQQAATSGVDHRFYRHCDSNNTLLSATVCAVTYWLPMAYRIPV